MGALAHYLETEGIPTTQISLIREHTESIQPPRALWVPFMLGRPLGVPGDPAFQRRVLLAALKLLDVDEGPVLEDFSEDAPSSADADESSLSGLACPVNFAAPPKEETGIESILTAFTREMAQFRSWYDLGVEGRGYSTVANFSPGRGRWVAFGFCAWQPFAAPRKHRIVGDGTPVGDTGSQSLLFRGRHGPPGFFND